jgi:hypothetical protein
MSSTKNDEPARCAVALGSGFLVSGIAMVPVEIEIYVEAACATSACVEAERVFRGAQHRSRFITSKSQDESSVHSFVSHAARLNDQGEPRPQPYAKSN